MFFTRKDSHSLKGLTFYNNDESCVISIPSCELIELEFLGPGKVFHKDYSNYSPQFFNPPILTTTLELTFKSNENLSLSVIRNLREMRDVRFNYDDYFIRTRLIRPIRVDHLYEIDYIVLEIDERINSIKQSKEMQIKEERKEVKTDFDFLEI